MLLEEDVVVAYVPWDPSLCWVQFGDDYYSFVLVVFVVTFVEAEVMELFQIAVVVVAVVQYENNL